MLPLLIKDGLVPAFLVLSVIFIIMKSLVAIKDDSNLDSKITKPKNVKGKKTSTPDVEKKEGSLYAIKILVISYIYLYHHDYIIVF